MENKENDIFLKDIVKENKTRYLSLTIPKEYNNKMIKELLKNKLHFNRKMIDRVKHRKNGIMLDDVYCFVNHIVKIGQNLKIRLSDIDYTNNLKLSVWAIPDRFMPPLSILYEDNDILLVNKPFGVSIHPSPGHYHNTLSNQVAEYLNIKTGSIYPVGRLDKDTSGIVLFAKNSDSASILTSEQLNKDIKKTYLAWVEGNLTDPYITIDKPIKEKDDTLMIREVSPYGKKAKTFVKKLRFDEKRNRTLVKVNILNGRTHQIRVHLSYIGHPICEDRIYNKDFICNMPSNIKEYIDISDKNNFLKYALKLEAYKISFLTPYFYERKEIILEKEKRIDNL